jgi:hypothetical protein
MCAGCFRVGPRGRLVRVWAVCGFIALVCLLRVCLMHYVYMHDIHLFKAACASKSTVSHLDGMCVVTLCAGGDSMKSATLRVRCTTKQGMQPLYSACT